MSVTHWSPKCWQCDRVPSEGLPTTPEAAAQLVLESDPKHSEEAAFAWGCLQAAGYAWITVDGWANGERTNTSRSVMVTLHYDARPPVEE